MSSDTVPYGILDPSIVELCRAINEFPGIITLESCQGYIDGHRRGQAWCVFFVPHPDITFEGYCAIEFLAWLLGDQAGAEGFDVSFGLKSFPPYLNTPGESAYFYIRGRNRHPDELAIFIQKLRVGYFRVPERE